MSQRDEGREEDQIPQSLLQLNRETVDSWCLFLFTSPFFSLVFSHHSLLLCASPLLSLLSVRILMYSIKLPSFLPHSLWLFPALHSQPLLFLLYLMFFSHLCSSSLPSLPSFLCSFNTTTTTTSSFLLNFPLPSLPCITGLWRRWVPVHHQGDNHPHGELQLPCLWL